MSKNGTWRRLSPKSLFTLLLTVTVSVAALVYFLPRESKFGYAYEQNKPWRYQQLIASYDFPIYKYLTLQVNGGVQNITNSYQKDFDKGWNRDSGYIYGPSLPRSYYVGMKINY